MKISDKLKWWYFSCFTGIALTNVNYYPLNIFIHGSGVIFWTVSGYLSKDMSHTY